jgi:hypothetical protein
MPVVLGVLAGATLGSRVLARAAPRTLRVVFGVVIAILGVEMMVHGASGRL